MRKTKKQNGLAMQELGQEDGGQKLKRSRGEGTVQLLSENKKEGRRLVKARMSRWSEEEGRERRERLDRKNSRESKKSQVGSRTEESIRVRDGSGGLIARPRL